MSRKQDKLGKALQAASDAKTSSLELHRSSELLLQSIQNASESLAKCENPERQNLLDALDDQESLLEALEDIQNAVETAVFYADQSVTKMNEAIHDHI